MLGVRPLGRQAPAGPSSCTSAPCATTTPACSRQLGPDTGFDSIGDFPQARSLSRYLDALDSTAELPRTVLYNLNPADNYVFRRR